MKKQILHMVARSAARKIDRQALHACAAQEKIFYALLQSAAHTRFGQDHGFGRIDTYGHFTQQVPLGDYHSFTPYIDAVREGRTDVLWPGKSLYMAKTSGTTGGYKYIPISRQGMPQHIRAARNALLYYIAQTGNTGLADGKLMFLQGSPGLEKINGVLTGRLSGIVAHYVPWYLRANRLPTYATNCIADWNEKVNAIVQETQHADMRLLGGIPAWLLHYIKTLLDTSGKKTVAELYPNLQLLVHGGVSYAPYRDTFNALFGKPVDTLETYPATEGFIAWQYKQGEPGLLLNTDAGMFYEFVAPEDLQKPSPKRVWLKDVELHKNYALVLSTNSGLFGYVIGDTVRFVSKNPYCIVVTGRVREYVSAFGEQVYAHQTDTALTQTMAMHGGRVNEYHVFPALTGAKPRHTWLIEFDEMPHDMKAFAEALDTHMHAQNIYYRDIVHTGVIAPLEIKTVHKNGFYSAMAQADKLGGQHKMPRLASNADFAQMLWPYIKPR